MLALKSCGQAILASADAVSLCHRLGCCARPHTPAAAACFMRKQKRRLAPAFFSAVILSEAKDLRQFQSRSFTTFRMTKDVIPSLRSG
jgi:hypothetical protein